MSTIEFRRELRLPTSLFVNVVLDDDESYLCRATNISRNGVHLLRLPVARRDIKFAWLLFWLPSSDHLIRVLGEVVHSDRRDELDHIGFHFKYIDPKYRRLLDAYLQEWLDLPQAETAQAA